MQFTKMHGAGNDYVYVNCFEETFPGDPSELARKMADRRFGVGGDGLIFICPTDQADAEMRMFNLDGSEAEMCGNGVRCVAKYVYDHGIKQADTLKIATGAGVLDIDVYTSNGKAESLRVDMGEPRLSPAEIPTTLEATSADGFVVNAPLDVAGRNLVGTCVSMGNPHCVIYVEEANDDLVLGAGPQIETCALFPARTNVEFIEIISRGEVRQRTWERGSGETWACGTGASAVCVAGVLSGRTDRELLVHLRGGDLQLEWRQSDNHVYMTGGAEEVFTGHWNQ